MSIAKIFGKNFKTILHEKPVKHLSVITGTKKMNKKTEKKVVTCDLSRKCKAEANTLTASYIRAVSVLISLAM